MKLAILASLFASAAAFAPANTGRATTQIAETKSDLQALGKQLNPLVGYFDPLGLTDSALWGQSTEFTIGWLRQAEVKHGRVAMAAFVGYCVQSNFHWPWAMTMKGAPFPGTDMSPPEQWDALPFGSKLQIILFVGFLEFYSELSPGAGAESGQIHYTQGGQPGKFPTFDAIPHSVPFNLYDPFKFSTNMSDETKEKRLRAELNNGRLAQLAIIAFLSAQTIPGSVPLLAGIVKPYAGEVMAPFAADFTL
eukprot:CAMPEP_0197232426 /NCGR_PEP_ID=MMETSP1429-20130617/629_1 /TAXON_ID=49237 /ORGANISM="Chaetoceros  sp., Strain UNC1202" /LENGTH=249 /DNA_ID=CAMNT_0042690437 /DNA_START=159 /DNA_END=908 /DNA_ORIENTATION=-